MRGAFHGEVPGARDEMIFPGERTSPTLERIPVGCLAAVPLEPLLPARKRTLRRAAMSQRRRWPCSKAPVAPPDPALTH